MGTLILQEIPQCSPIESQKELTIDFFNPTKSENELSIDFLSNLLDSFRNMSESDQALFMNLHNRFQNVTNFNDKTKKVWDQINSKKDRKGAETLEKVTEIYGIYKTNCNSRGVAIHISRFNHSCAPNAENVWRSGENDACEIRAVSKIKPGDEITVNYNPVEIVLKNLKIRQELLLDSWGFGCDCTLCKEEKVNSDIEKY